MTANPIPDGYHSIMPYLFIKGAAKAMEFYKAAFGATEVLRLDGPNGAVMHAEMQLGDSRIMMADECPEMKVRAPDAPGAAGVSFCVYLENVDEMVARAVEAGAVIQRPLQDQFYGDRSATLEDPFGHVWTLATHIEDVSQEEIDRRFEEMMKQGPPADGNT